MSIRTGISYDPEASLGRQDLLEPVAAHANAAASASTSLRTKGEVMAASSAA